MSPKNSLLATGLTALGLVGFASFGVADPPSAPSGSATSVAPAPANAVLLLKNGGVVQGLISEDPSSYVLHVKGSRIPYNKKQVLSSFATLEEAYQYQKERLAERDPDENMKLARWCLTNHLPNQAKVELQAVLALSPANRDALSMINKIKDEEARRAARDTGVMQANAVVDRSQPEPLDRATLDRASRAMGISSLPQIPGLSAVASVKRVDEFRKFVHPVLQKTCVRCHNEAYTGEFRLVLTKSRTGATPDAVRANLDATLRLVDWENPAKSELLSSTLRQHGATKRPIFVGANDRTYQILAQWVNLLHAAPTAQASRSQPTKPFLTVNAEGEGGERFASRRSDGVPLPLTPTPASGARPQPPETFPEPVPLPPGQLLPGSGSSMEAYAPPDTEFPVSALQGGPKPNVAQEANLAAQANGRKPAPPRSLPPLPTDGALDEPSDEADVAQTAKPKKPKTPVKVDPALLQKALMNRFAPQ